MDSMSFPPNGDSVNLGDFYVVIHGNFSGYPQVNSKQPENEFWAIFHSDVNLFFIAGRCRCQIFQLFRSLLVGASANADADNNANNQSF